jgi:CPA1 family monovalent cation:H+ antiporter
MALLEVVLAMLVVAILLAHFSEALRIPYAVLLVIAGMALAFVPGLPALGFDPQLTMALFLPPLLFSAAYFTSWRDFRFYLRPILLLAIGLVLATTLGVGLVFKWLVPEVPWAVAFLLGAIVSPPDAVAAAAIMEKLRLPKRIVAILEGESLVNDACSTSSRSPRHFPARSRPSRRRARSPSMPSAAARWAGRSARPPCGS